jgi:hypothetical protein
VSKDAERELLETILDCFKPGSVDWTVRTLGSGIRIDIVCKNGRIEMNDVALLVAATQGQANFRPGEPVRLEGVDREGQPFAVVITS